MTRNDRVTLRWATYAVTGNTWRMLTEPRNAWTVAHDDYMTLVSGIVESAIDSGGIDGTTESAWRAELSYAYSAEPERAYHGINKIAGVRFVLAVA